MQDTQNIYTLKFSGKQCNYSILINGLPMVHFYQKGILSTRFPINHLILESGTQEVKIQVYPLANASLSEGSRLEVSVAVSNTTDHEYRPLIAHTTPVFQGKEKFYEESYFFEADVSYQLEGWASAAVLKRDQDLSDEVITYYRSLHTMLSNKKYTQFYELFVAKNKEIDSAMYSDPSTSKKEWDAVVAELEKSKMTLSDFPQDCALQYYCDDKVVTLFQKKATSVLLFENKEQGLAYDIPIYLHKKSKKASFDIIR